MITSPTSPQRTARFVTDADVARLLPMPVAVELMATAVRRAHEGTLIHPPRVAADVGVGRLTFTCGAVPGDWFGYRSYLAPGDHDDEQVVIVQDAGTGALRAVYAGRDLGPRRTGAIGGVAIDALAPAGTVTVAVLGTGRQAWEQVLAAVAVRRVRCLSVFSPTPAHREAFGARVAAQVGGDLAVRLCATAQEAVEGQDVVVVATSSPEPVLSVDWLHQTRMVSTLGPKQQHRHEFPLALAQWADTRVTDSPAQLTAYEPPFALAGQAVAEQIVPLGAALGAGPPARAVFFSAGLAGTEAFLLAHLSRVLVDEDPDRPGEGDGDGGEQFDADRGQHRSQRGAGAPPGGGKVM